MIQDVRFKVVGVSFEGRQANHEKFQRLGIGVYLEREPANPHDRNAIKVVAQYADATTAQLGYIGKQYAEIIAPIMDKGGTFRADVSDRGFSDRVGCFYMEVTVNQQ